MPPKRKQPGSDGPSSGPIPAVPSASPPPNAPTGPSNPTPSASGGPPAGSKAGTNNDPTAQEDEMEILLLGAGQEVGRSCVVIKYKGRTVVCDAGVHPAFTGMGALPFIDELDWSTVDCILISHFHLDHAASLTYVMEKTNFKDGNGSVYMTHPTKAVYRFFMQDFVRVSTSSPTSTLFTESDLHLSWSSIIGIDFHQQISIPARSIRFTPYHAGHVLGAAMFGIELAGRRVLYTGDYSTEEDRHLVPARWGRGRGGKADGGSSGKGGGAVTVSGPEAPIAGGPSGHVDVMICESTYGVQSVEPRLVKEQRFTTEVTKILKRGGRVLMPVFALGRAQELILVLDEHWSHHPELQHIPIYVISSMASKSLRVFQKFVHTMNDNIRTRFARGDNPFAFERNRFVKLMKGMDKLDDSRPCVVVASPGMLQNGISRELLEKWAPDRRNGLLVTGYSVEGTMARTILNEPDEIIGMNGQKIPRRMTVDYISFSAHVDYTQNSKFIDDVMPTHLVLVHGEVNNMNRLRSALKDKYAERKEDIQIHTPRNVDPLNIKFQGERIAKAIGSLADLDPSSGQPFNGLLVQKDFSYTLIAPEDLKDFTGLSTSTILQRQLLNVGSVGWELVKWHLSGMYGRVDEGVDQDGTPTMRIMQTVDLKMLPENEGVLSIEWVGSATNDMIADSVLALLLTIEESPASAKYTSRPHPHAEPHSPPPDATIDEIEAQTAENLIGRLDRLIAFLDSHFGNVEMYIPGEEDAPATSGGEGGSDGRENEVSMVKAEEPEPVEIKQEDRESTPVPANKPKPFVVRKADSRDIVEATKRIRLEQNETEDGKALSTTDRTHQEPGKRRRGGRKVGRSGKGSKDIWPMIKVTVDGHYAVISTEDFSIRSGHGALKHRVQAVTDMAIRVITPLDTSQITEADGPFGKAVLGKVVSGLSEPANPPPPTAPLAMLEKQEKEKDAPKKKKGKDRKK